MSMMDKGKEVFQEEAKELLAELESSLMELEDNPGDNELISRVFRAMHTIKGSGSMFGYDTIAKFTHEIETAFDQVRSGKVVMTKDLGSVTLEARDLIKSMLESPDGGAGPHHAAQAAAILSRLREIMPAEGAQEKATETSDKADVQSGEPITFRIFFKPNRDVFKTGNDPASLVEEVAALGECTVLACTDDVPLLKEMDPELCYTQWSITLTTDRGKDAIQDIFIFVQEESEVRIEQLETADDAGQKKIGEILVEQGATTQSAIAEALAKQKRLGDVLQEAGVVNVSAVEAALAEQQHLKSLAAKKQSEEATMSVRVAADKLDRLVDLVGEMVTVQARLSQAATGKDNASKSDFRSIAEEVERLTSELRDNTMSIRMMQIGTTFSKFKRLVRDLSRDLGKEIELTTEGAETELDKTVIERLGDPLVHLIRNSIDHGIELPDTRAAAGKPRTGTVRLSAVHSGAYVLIQIKDDGAGLDPEIIRAKAVEKELIAFDAELSDKELFTLILAPGFSTAKRVTNVSGRGVGMDVVKRAIDALRGSIDISSQKGLGTTLTLKLPLTLAIIDGFLTKIGEECFIFPLSIVEECVELTRKDSTGMHGRHLANVRGKLVPYVRLREQFSIRGEAPAIEQIVIIGSDGQRVGFVVDTIIGGHQTVIKNLGKFYREVEGISGATILGDGTVALILDVPKLVQSAAREEVNV